MASITPLKHAESRAPRPAAPPRRRLQHRRHRLPAIHHQDSPTLRLGRAAKPGDSTASHGLSLHQERPERACGHERVVSRHRPAARPTTLSPIFRPDFVPYWDFSQSGTAPRDSSAARHRRLRSAGPQHAGQTQTAVPDTHRRAKHPLLAILHRLPRDRIAPMASCCTSAAVPKIPRGHLAHLWRLHFLQGCYARALRRHPVTSAPLQLQAVKSISPGPRQSGQSLQRQAQHYNRRANTIIALPQSSPQQAR